MCLYLSTTYIPFIVEAINQSNNTNISSQKDELIKSLESLEKLSKSIGEKRVPLMKSVNVLYIAYKSLLLNTSEIQKATQLLQKHVEESATGKRKTVINNAILLKALCHGFVAKYNESKEVKEKHNKIAINLFQNMNAHTLLKWIQ
jgi:hypothetical protein